MPRKSGQICVQRPRVFANNKDMRFAAFALMACLTGCSMSPTGSSSECNSDTQCGDDVCARTGECLAHSSVRSVTVTWTVDGVAAADSSCADHPNLYLQFDSVDYGDSVRFTPVPCKEGSFFVDKLPTRYRQVEMGVEGDARTGDAAPIDAATARAQIDLLP
jgi:hypothetical protein